MLLDVLPGQSFPLGATVYPWGVNFCVFSKNCARVELLLFDGADDAAPRHVIPLDPQTNRTFYYWHVFVRGIGAGQLYGYRVHGPHIPEEMLRFDGAKLLLDPYARGIVMGDSYRREAARQPGDNCAHAMKSVVVDLHAYDWEGDMPLCRPYAETVIYEMHVGGFTRHPSSGLPAEQRGTYAGVIEKIPYLRELGVTAVELLPVQHFDPQDAPRGLPNYWGYSPIGFFAPHSAYSADRHPLGPVNEFRDMVKALHRAGIEVILDVVFNHTSEGDHTGPTQSFRGFESRAYYIHDKDPTRYANYTGTGNTLNTNQSIVRRLIMDCLHHWVAQMHVDGFRFDLASVLARDEWGEPLESPPILWEIESDPVLAGTKIIAEAWDAAGLYQVGTFIGHRWAEWNGQYRDTVRRFVKSDRDTVPALAARLLGSPDLYVLPDRSVNFITSHDGFTLNDLVSYNQKHNAANREGNRDGADHNDSWNCGVEGPTLDPEIEALRLRQIKNFFTVLFFSQGTPMILMGDEVRHTQRGNNNVYCQDNELAWFDWRDVERHADLLRFVQGLIALNQSLPVFRQDTYLTIGADADRPHLIWHGVKRHAPDWGRDSHALAFELRHPQAGDHLYVMLNAYWEPLTFEIPPLAEDAHWVRVVDTTLAAPHDFTPPEEAARIPGPHYRAGARSSVVLLARQ